MRRCPTEPEPLRWARTGGHLTRKEWLEDYLSGLLWFVGIFVVLWMVVEAVGAISR